MHGHIEGNTEGEGNYLKNTDAEGRKHRYQTGLDTLVVYAVNYECKMLYLIIMSKLTRKHSAWGLRSQD